MNRLIAYTLAGIAIATGASASPAFAGEYGSQYFGFSTYLTWSLNDDTGTSASLESVVGYACVTKDALESMSRSGSIERYAIYADPTDNTLYLEPLNGVAIAPGNGGFIARDAAPQPAQSIWDYAQLNAAGSWFLDDTEPDALGLACVDGGIAGALQQLQQDHAMPIRME